jgi:D-amino-acid dehydrogenase
VPKLAVVGAGIVGLCCAWSARQRGWDVTLIDRDFEGDRASHGNAGGIAVSECLPLRLSGLGLKPLRWLIDPLGPLSIRIGHAPALFPWWRALRKVSEPHHYQRIALALAALNRSCLTDFEALLSDLGMRSALHREGALAVYESEAGFAKDGADWELKRQLGMRFQVLGQDALAALEPGLLPVFPRGVLLEDWAHVDDPFAIVVALRERAKAQGAELVTGEVRALDLAATDRPAAILSDGRRIERDRLVVSAGAWSALLARSAGDRVLLESERGYNTTLPASAGLLRREVIFAERQFVATPLSLGLRIGGAAEFAGLHAPPNYRRSRALLELGRRYLRDLDERGAREWMGQRPTTPDSLPVIGPSKVSDHLLYAFGHGHLGLTQAATTGEMIGALLAGDPPHVALDPYSIGRF